MTTGWLLVVDNADDQNLLGDFLPQEGQGHVLLTARDPEVGTRATTIVVKKTVGAKVTYLQVPEPNGLQDVEDTAHGDV